MKAVYRISAIECFGDSKDTHVGGVGQFVVEIIECQVGIPYETVHSLAYHTQSFLYDFFKTFSDSHDFSYRFHARTYTSRYTYEFAQVPTGYFADEIVETRSNVGRVAGSHFSDLVESVAQCQFGGDKSQRITGCFRGKGR